MAVEVAPALESSKSRMLEPIIAQFALKRAGIVR
jgi:hypothetical protein